MRKFFFVILAIFLFFLSSIIIPAVKVKNDEYYDFLIITPSEFIDGLNPLLEHKFQHGISAKIIDVNDIYQGKFFPVVGRDYPEEIKYFLKDAYEQWGVEYVMLVGSKDEIPVRYVDLCNWDNHYECISELYYADLFDSKGDFCSWDSDNDNVFGGQDMDGMIDEVDFYPDLAIGRILCKTLDEVNIVVDKIIDYENNANGESWFNNVVLCGGDDARLGLREKMFEEWFKRPAEIVWEGEYLGDAVEDIMIGFNPVKVYATGLLKSESKFLSSNNINEAINQGAGFVMFIGHGNYDKAIKTNFPMIKFLWLPFPGGYTTIHSRKLQNQEKLPVVIFGGCNSGDFHAGNSPIAWEFIKNQYGGAIACFAATTGSIMFMSSLVTEAYTPHLILNIFRFYQQGIVTIGDIWQNSIKAYLDDEEAWQLGVQFSLLNWHNDLANYLVMEEWTLFGDPTLKIGGY